MTIIIDHNHPAYKAKRSSMKSGRFNGAFYYSKEIVRNIIPNIETDRNWITVNVQGVGCNHAIVFIHNNLRPSNYDWLKLYGYKDLILVCGIPETCEKVKHLGTPIYLPLSIDTEEVKQYKTSKTKDTAFVGRRAKRKGIELPDGIDFLEDMPRSKLLPAMAQYENIYAVGRTAIEAKALGCKLKAYDPRFPKVSRWKVVDNLKAAEMLQKELDRIDG